MRKATANRPLLNRSYIPRAVRDVVSLDSGALLGGTGRQDTLRFTGSAGQLANSCGPNHAHLVEVSGSSAVPFRRAGAAPWVPRLSKDRQPLPSRDAARSHPSRIPGAPAHLIFTPSCLVIGDGGPSQSVLPADTPPCWANPLAAHPAVSHRFALIPVPSSIPFPQRTGHSGPGVTETPHSRQK